MNLLKNQQNLPFNGSRSMSKATELTDSMKYYYLALLNYPRRTNHRSF